MPSSTQASAILARNGESVSTPTLPQGHGTAVSPSAASLGDSASRNPVLAAVLNAREARWQRKQELAERFGVSVLALGLNIPGPDKTPPGSLELLGILSDALDALLRAADATLGKHRVYHDETVHSADGAYRLLALDMPPEDMKRLAMQLEEVHFFGRLADADVLSPGGRPISRRDLGVAPRKCFICGEEAALCCSRASHPAPVVWHHVHRILEAAARQAPLQKPQM